MEKPERTSKPRASCDLCKRMKIRCEKQGERCNHCIARDAECIVTLVPRKRRQPKRVGYINSMENRIERMESMMRASGINLDGTKAVLPAEDGEGLAEISDKLSMLTMNKGNGSHFLGSASGFSLFSQRGLHWISEKTGSFEFANVLQGLNKESQGIWGVSSSSMFHQTPEHGRMPLPPRDLADLYIKCYFETFNVVFPLFNHDHFIHRYSTQYPCTFSEDIAWYASLNIVLGMGCLVHQSHNQYDRSCAVDLQGNPAKDDCWNYFRNAASGFVDLIFTGGSLMAVQAIVGMTFIMQAIPDPHPSYILAATALRLAQSIGLHRRLDNFGLAPEEVEQRRNVFWLAFMLEKTISLRSGRPSAMHEDDIGVGMPKLQENLPEYPNGQKRFAIFNHIVSLSLVESRAYSGLYSARSQTRPSTERLKLIGTLDGDLRQWRDALPVEIRPGKEVQCHEFQVVPVLMMHFAYFNCLATIHRASVHHGSWPSAPENEGQPDKKVPGLSPRVFASGEICLNAARGIISILHDYITARFPYNKSLLRMADYYPLTASLALFAHILQNPLHPKVESDLGLMKYVTDYLSRSFGLDDSLGAVQATGVTSKLKIFLEINRLASLAVAKARIENANQTRQGFTDSNIDERNSSSFPGSGSSGPSNASKASSTSPPAMLNLQPLQPPSKKSQPTPQDLWLPTTNPSATDPLASYNYPFSPTELQIQEPHLAMPADPFHPPSSELFDDFPGGAGDPLTSESYLPFDETADADFLMATEGSWVFPGTFQWDLANVWTGRDGQG